MRLFWVLLVIVSFTSVIIKILSFYKFQQENIGAYNLPILNKSFVILIYSVFPWLVLFASAILGILKRPYAIICTLYFQYSFILVPLIVLIIRNRIFHNLILENLAQLIVFSIILGFSFFKIKSMNIFSSNYFFMKTSLLVLLFSILYVVIGYTI